MRCSRLGSTLLFALGSLAACGDDDGADADTSATTDVASDTTGESDATGAETTATPDAVDTETELVVTTGAYGRVRLYHNAALAEFQPSMIIVHAPDSLECVVFLNLPPTPNSDAGTLRVGGSIVGAPGGLDAALDLTPDGSMQYVYFGPVLPADDSYRAEIGLTGNATFPAFATRTYQPPAAASVAITAPPQPPDQPPATEPQPPPYVIPSTEDLEITWEVPAGDVSEHEVIFGFSWVTGSTSKIGNLYCGFPMAAGRGVVPVELLADLKQRSGDDVFGLLHIFAGDGDRFMVDGTLYVVEVTRFPDSTNWNTEYQAELR